MEKLLTRCHVRRANPFYFQLLLWFQCWARSLLPVWRVPLIPLLCFGIVQWINQKEEEGGKEGWNHFFSIWHRVQSIRSVQIRKIPPGWNWIFFFVFFLFSLTFDWFESFRCLCLEKWSFWRQVESIPFSQTWWDQPLEEWSFFCTSFPCRMEHNLFVYSLERSFWRHV